MPTDPIRPENDLILRVQRLLDSERLPVESPEAREVIASYGSAEQSCCVCEREIGREEIAYDIADQRNATARLIFHIDCYLAWQNECLNRHKEVRL